MGRTEVAEAARGEVRRGIAAASQQADLLTSIASRISELAGAILVDSSPAELRRNAHDLRGGILHGLGVLAELQRISGQLESMAAIRDAADADVLEPR